MQKGSPYPTKTFDLPTRFFRRLYETQTNFFAKINDVTDGERSARTKLKPAINFSRNGKNRTRGTERIKTETRFRFYAVVSTGRFYPLRAEDKNERVARPRTLSPEPKKLPPYSNRYGDSSPKVLRGSKGRFLESAPWRSPSYFL